MSGLKFREAFQTTAEVIQHPGQTFQRFLEVAGDGAFDIVLGLGDAIERSYYIPGVDLVDTVAYPGFHTPSTADFLISLGVSNAQREVHDRTANSHQEVEY